MTRKPLKQRLEEQAVRQKEQRDKDRAACAPSRDDVARMALWWLISNTWKDPRARRRFDAVRKELTDLLVSQGFDAKACDNEIERLYAAYRTERPPFRIKRHLKPNKPPEHLR